MEKLSFREKFSYGLGDLSSNIIFAAISFYLLYFIVNVAGLNAALAGIIFIIARFWDAVTDYFMGVISDKTKSKYGKRRVYMLFGAIPFGLTFVLLWITPFQEDTADFIKFLYYTGIYMLFNVVWTIVYVPYNALTANITQNYDERTSLNGIRIILANVGILLGAALFALFAEGEESLFASLLGNVKAGYLLSSVIFGVLAGIIMLVCAINVKERYATSNTYHQGLFATLKQFFKLKEFRSIMMYYLLSMVGFDIIMAVFLFFVNDALGFGQIGGGEVSMIFIALPLIFAIVSALFWVKLSEKYNKVKVYTFATIWIVLALLACVLVPAYSQDNSLVAYLSLGAVVIAVGIGMSAVQILPWASVPDVVEVDEYVNGTRREGAYYGVVQFMYKTASGIAIAFVGIMLKLFHYVESVDGISVPQPEEALLAIRWIMGLLPGILFIVSVYFGRKADLNRERFNFIKNEISKRNEKGAM
jgi:sugar (glycoside-pentoside-hexuronide) transporter